MYEFFEALNGLGIKYLLYADDTFIYCTVISLTAHQGKLQEALRLIAQWCQYWKLLIRPDKCHAVNLSRRQGECEFDFSINSGLIVWTEEIKFLVFYVTRRGGFRKHVEYLRLKAFKRVKILKALSKTRYGARSYHLLILTTSSIRSMIEYSATTLNTANAIRTALGLPKWVPNNILRKQADIFPLFDRISSLAFGFWIKHRALSNWSPLWDFHEGTLHLVTGSAPVLMMYLKKLMAIRNILPPFRYLFRAIMKQFSTF